jgi:hypothetical protein
MGDKAGQFYLAGFFGLVKEEIPGNHLSERDALI